MNNQESHLPEIQSRMESEDWNYKIANSVSIKYEKKQTRNRIIFSSVSLILITCISMFAFSLEGEFLGVTISELDTIRILLSDDILHLFETGYEDEFLSSLIDPISLFR